MGVAPKIPPPGFDELAADQQIDYINELWGRVITRPDPASVPEWQRQILAERLAEYRAGKVRPGRSWEDVRRDLEAELAKVRR